MIAIVLVLILAFQKWVMKVMELFWPGLSQAKLGLCPSGASRKLPPGKYLAWRTRETTKFGEESSYQLFLARRARLRPWNLQNPMPL